MPRTNLSSQPASTAASSRSEHHAGGGLCAIHQPNLSPRLHTLAKLFAADFWIVLDDVQFARRDYQHRTRLAALSDPQSRQWLSIPTHLPRGRQTVLREALMAEPVRSGRRTARMVQWYYGAGPHWPVLSGELERVLRLFTATDRTAVVAEASTVLLLDLLGWQGRVLHSSDLPSRPERSQRLADLTHATGCHGYLCGPGGMNYLDHQPFLEHHLTVTAFAAPEHGIWESSREISALWALMRHGPDAVGTSLTRLAVTTAPRRLPSPKPPVTSGFDAAMTGLDGARKTATEETG
ncbi:WbqC family protein [Streptomyces sp. ISL-11]|uniref:WbqC family protein n=1 Tax=Streptomyces sp. ISL-11 TaxID=2819174 RepID=UPI001BE7CCB2|nr:WbqC family protein [Streptomyces sp. ISL-11]MBT2383575.1 WbqC family protein [Streptomyces sp. ISL-11]